MLKNYQYNIDEIAKNIRINVRKRKLYLADNTRHTQMMAYNPMSMSQRNPVGNQDLTSEALSMSNTQSAYQVGNLCDATVDHLGSHLSFGIGTGDGRPQQNIDVIQEIPSL